MDKKGFKTNRRNFLKGTAGAAALTVAPITISTAKAESGQSSSSSNRETLGSPISELKSNWDVVVIGSGYGGAIAAARLAEHFDLAILERGKEHKAGDFPDTSSGLLFEVKTPSNPLGLVEVVIGDDVDVLQGSGLGGTSLINANALIVPEDDHFDSAEWPAEITADRHNGKLGELYGKVHEMLGASKVSVSRALPKQRHLFSTTKNIVENGGSAYVEELNLTVNIDKYNDEPNAHGVVQSACTFCGDCVTGCNVGAKNTLDVNYLPLARNNGAKIFTQCVVDTVEKLNGGKYQVNGNYISDDGDKEPFTLEASNVILAAGSLGSTGILMRSQAQKDIQFSSQLGECFSGNGDVLGMNYNGDVFTEIEGHGTGTDKAPGHPGPTLSAVATHNGPNGEFIIEEGAIPSGIIAAARYASATFSPGKTIPETRRVLRDLALTYKNGAMNHSQVYLGIGKETTVGNIGLDGNNNPKVNWPGAKNDPTISAIRNAMKEHTKVFNGNFIENPRSQWFGGNNLITVHPLGGCKVGTSVSEGVVNHKGQLFDPATGNTHDGLYVCDGAILPGAVGVNPFSVISVLAERIAEIFINEKLV